MPKSGDLIWIPNYATGEVVLCAHFGCESECAVEYCALMFSHFYGSPVGGDQ